jgi:alkylation response protein AidB-like acyl-CoA dehydrogenase
VTDALDAADLDGFRTRCREFLDAHRHMAGRHQPGETDDASRARAVAYQRALADEGLAGITFPAEYGGAGLTAEHQRVFNEEAEGFESPASLFMIGLGMCAPTILAFGTEDQKRALLPGLLRADTLWCQLFSEPGAGSDIASLQTRAVRDGDEWVVNGQKVWTSGAHYCDYGLMLARTNPDVPKHRGISMFVVDMHTAGVDPRPLRQIDGRAHFNEVFISDARLRTGALLGPVDEGWRCAVTMLMNERAALGAGNSGQGLSSEPFEGLVALARLCGAHRDPLVRQALVDVYLRERTLLLLGARLRAAVQAGRAPGPEASVGKIAITTLDKIATGLALGIVGPGGVAWDPGDGAAEERTRAFLQAPGISIAGGTTEVQKNIIGERVLGLPKEPQIDRDTPFRDLMVGTQAR